MHTFLMLARIFPRAWERCLFNYKVFLANWSNFRNQTSIILLTHLWQFSNFVYFHRGNTIFTPSIFTIAAQFFKKERNVSAVRKNWWERAQNALFFSALFDSTLPVKLLQIEVFLSVFHSFIIIHMHIAAFGANQLVYYNYYSKNCLPKFQYR